MKNLLSTLKSDPVFTAGAVLLAVGTLVFCLPLQEQGGWVSAKFLLAYLSLAGFFVAAVVENKRLHGRLFTFRSLPHNLVLLLLANLSAYSLNLNMPVFEPSADWLSVFLVLLNLAVLQVAVRRRFEEDWLNHLTVAILAAGTLVQGWQALHVLPASGMALLLFWFFGIPLHLLVPAWFAAALGLLLRRFVKTSSGYWKSAATGWALPLVFLVAFVARWNSVSRQTEQVWHEAVAPLEERELPAWAYVGQRIELDWITRRILGSRSRGGFGEWTGKTFEDAEGKRRHDPLVAASWFLARKMELPESERTSLRAALLDARHQSEPRLWSGEDLRVRDIATNVQLFPDHRLAYAEKTLTIENTHGFEGSQQEAIFTFHLPEGSVVTSASLWVGGVEEKAVLTTRHKADTAYQTIVGRERRDPLLVRWQEGGRVTARVFPCTPKERRQFKIGVTSPLRFSGGRLFYENIRFEGPPAGQAKETIQVLTEGTPVEIKSSLPFSQKGGYLSASGGGSREDWSLDFEAPPLSEQAFSFNGRSFQLRPLPEVVEPVSCREIYLDASAGWSKKQFNAVWEKSKGREVFAWCDGMVRLTEENKDAMFRELGRLKFSVFPFHKIRRPAEAVVVSGSGSSFFGGSEGAAPAPDDLKGSKFSERLGAFFGKSERPVRVLFFGKKLPPYLAALSEARAVQVRSGEPDELLQLLESQRFPAWQEDEGTVVLDRSAVKIKELPPAAAADATTPPAPDHLLRLFAYNDLMRQVGKQYFQKENLGETLIGQAQEAWVVTPFSSLVTLETQADYERFDISQPAANSLKNASIGSKGAVPEPQEWLLAAVCAAVAAGLFWRRT